MAKMDDLFDAGRGKLGNLVFYKRNGIGIVRTKPEHFSDRKSPAQLAQRQKLQVVNDFLRPFLKLIRVTFVPETEGRVARSEAQSVIMRNALAGEYPNIYVDKSRALLSRGTLPLPVHAQVSARPEGLLIQWQNGEEATGPRRFDTLVIMAYSESAGQGDYKLTGVYRKEGQCTWKPALPLQDGPLPAVWIAFRNEEEAGMSNSMYVVQKEE